MDSSHSPGPKVLPDNARFWEAAAKGELLMPRCLACGEFHWYPRRHCPFCFSDQIEWVQSAGKGSIYSFSVMRKADGGPYVIAYVELDEGVTVLSNIVAIEPDQVEVGGKVRVVFQASASGQAVPMFEPEVA